MHASSTSVRIVEDESGFWYRKTENGGFTGPFGWLERKTKEALYVQEVKYRCDTNRDCEFDQQLSTSCQEIFRKESANVNPTNR